MLEVSTNVDYRRPVSKIEKRILLRDYKNIFRILIIGKMNIYFSVFINLI